MLVKYITLFDANDFICCPKSAPNHIRLKWVEFNVIPANIIEVEHLDNGALGIGYWHKDKPVYREYSGRYDLVQIEPDEYTAEVYFADKQVQKVMRQRKQGSQL